MTPKQMAPGNLNKSAVDHGSTDAWKYKQRKYGHPEMSEPHIGSLEEEQMTNM